MNDFEKMQQIYEEGVGQAPFPYNNVGGKLRGLRTSNRGTGKYRQSPPGSQISIDRTSPKLSYKTGIPTVHPGKQGDNYSSPGSQNYSIPTAKIVSDEEEGTLTRAEIKSAIVEELEDANPDCTFALDALAKKLGIKIEYPN